MENGDLAASLQLLFNFGVPTGILGFMLFVGWKLGSYVTVRLFNEDTGIVTGWMKTNQGLVAQNAEVVKMMRETATRREAADEAMLGLLRGLCDSFTVTADRLEGIAETASIEPALHKRTHKALGLIMRGLRIWAETHDCDLSDIEKKVTEVLGL